MAGENNSRVFFCTACGICTDLGQSEPRVFPVSILLPEKLENIPYWYFPFWRYDVSYNLYLTQDSRNESRTRTVWVPSFFVKNISYFGDIGRYYTSRDIRGKPGRFSGKPVFPADRSEDHAAQYISVYINMIERENAAPGSEPVPIDINLQAVAVTLIPFYCKNNEFIDSFLLWKYPSGALI